MPKPDWRLRRINKAILFSCPHRLVAQDAALSRPKPGFEFLWGHELTKPYFFHAPSSSGARTAPLRRAYAKTRLAVGRQSHTFHAPIVRQRRARRRAIQTRLAVAAINKAILFHAPSSGGTKTAPSPQAYAKTRLAVAANQSLLFHAPSSSGPGRAPCQNQDLNRGAFFNPQTFLIASSAQSDQKAVTSHVSSQDAAYPQAAPKPGSEFVGALFNPKHFLLHSSAKAIKRVTSPSSSGLRRGP